VFEILDLIPKREEVYERWNDNLRTLGFNKRNMVHERFDLNEKLTDEKLVVLDRNIKCVFDNQNGIIVQTMKAQKVIVEKTETILEHVDNQKRAFNRFIEERYEVDNIQHIRMISDHKDIERKFEEGYQGITELTETKHEVVMMNLMEISKLLNEAKQAIFNVDECV
jgi:hypothetical protein